MHESTVEYVLSVFDRFRKPSKPEIDCYDGVGRVKLGEKFAKYIVEGRPI